MFPTDREADPGPPALTRARRIVQWTGLVGGPLAALALFLLLPDSYLSAAGEPVAFSAAGRATLGVMAWMGMWWLTEAVDISVTALLPIAVFPVAGIAGIGATTAPYADPVIFLFMGGFLLALSMQRWGLDQRIALITLRLVGTKPANMVAGFMLATAAISAFVSNTATAAMMLPIALSVIDLVLRQTTGRGLTGSGTLPEAAGRNFALCLLLGIAYAASIGGIATIIGTPPNVFLVGFIRNTIDPQYRREISFVRWLAVGVPLTAVFLPVVWLLLTRVLYPIRITSIEGGRDLVETKYRALGPASPGEWITVIVFTLTALAWIFRPIIDRGIVDHIDPATGTTIYVVPPLLPGITDTVIVMIAAMLLFVIPVRPSRLEFTLNWATARKLPWGILILFGGGLSLAGAVQANGVAEFIGSQTAAFGDVPDLVVVLAVVTIVIFLTELTSNTATTATFVPILAGLAPALGLHPYLLIVPAAIAASCAFMMPVATPPNAIVFGSGYVTIPQMCKAGFWLNMIGIALVTMLGYFIVGPLLIS